MDGCRRRSETRSMSSQTSGPTVDESHELARRDSPVTKWMSTEWTDEKHRLYLKSMEASFVDQLYNSMDLLGWNSQKEISDPKFLKHVNRDSCTSSSGQFKVLRQGVWQKVYLQNRPELQRDVAMETPGLLSSPWIQRFVSASKPQVVPSSTTREAASTQTQVINRRGKKTTSCGSTRSLKHSHPSHSHDMVDGNTGAVN
uniref:Uncharacterized protein LOC105129510 isoform X4 n=1 Tax=Rhizophora mucronata TaxID=61149 RepID=A0A2P2K4N2_RHIMU